MAFDAQQLATRWMAEPAAASLPTQAAEQAALAWALKDQGYEALQRQQREQAHAALAALCDLHDAATRAAARDAAAAPTSAEVGAAWAWLQGAERALAGAAQEALPLLDDARSALLALGLQQPAAACQVPKLIALAMLGRHAEALACGERTRAELAAAGDEPGAGRVEINLGSMLLRLHRYSEAARHYRQAAVRFARAQDMRHSVMADIGLAGALSWGLDWDEAERIYERASARIEAHGFDALAGVVHASRGLLAMRRGQHAKALQALETALRVFEQHGPPQRLAEARRDLADAYLALNLLPEALSLYDAAIAACIEQRAPVEQARATMQRALALARQGRGAEAAQGLAQARALFEAGGNTVGAARVATHAAELSLASGAAERALRLARTAHEGLSAAGTRGWALEAQALQASALAALGDNAGAQAAFQRLSAQSEGLPEMAARAQVGLGRLWQGMGRLDEAEQAFEQAALHVESQRNTLQGDEFRIAYGSDKRAAFDGLVELAAARQGRAADERLFACIERGRAAALRLASTEPGLDEAQRRQLHWLQQSLQEATARADLARVAELQGQVLALEALMLEGHRRGQAAASAPAAVAAPPAAAEVQAALARDEALVLYGGAGPGLLALVLRHDGLHRFELDAALLPQRIDQLRFQINALRFGAHALQRHGEQMLERCRSHLCALHRMVWQPLLPALQGAAHVVVVPQGALHGLPFSALDDGQRALLDDHAISQAPSVAAWLAARRAPPLPPPQRALALGVAGPALPHVAAEVRRVAATVGAGSVALLDEQATLAGLKQQLPGADLLHLACHGRFRDDSPAFSSLELADGPLTLRDAAALPLTGVRVVLSACETGLGRIAPGEEMVGLVRGFLMAGASQVLATLWTVDDAGTAELMADYCEGLAAGVAAPVALRAAQRAARQQRPHPYHWAPFTLHGA